MSIIQTVAMTTGIVANLSIIATVATVLWRDRVATARSIRSVTTMSIARAEVAADPLAGVDLTRRALADAEALDFPADAWTLPHDAYGRLDMGTSTWTALPLDCLTDTEPAPYVPAPRCLHGGCGTCVTCVADVLDTLPGPVLAEALTEARGWVDDCELACVPADDLPAANVWGIVAARYDGGIPAMVRHTFAGVVYPFTPAAEVTL